ncbi:Mu transposase C-terminal domain-containing protein [Deferribacteres bacterium DY0037]
MKIQLKENATFYCNGIKYVFKAANDSKSIYATNEENGKIEILNISDIMDSNSNEDERFPIYAESEEHELYYKIASERLNIIKPLLNRAPKKEVIARGKAFNVSYVTLYKWIKAYESSGRILSALAPKYNRRGAPNRSRLNENTEKVIQDLIETHYLTTQRKSKKSTYIKIKNLCNKLGYDVPSKGTVYNRIARIPSAKAHTKRYGAKPGYDQYGVVEDNFKADHPLSVIQIDHTPLDIQIVDEQYRRSIGRPYITLATDIYSRLPYGWYISLDNPSYFTVGQSIYIGIRDKERQLKTLGIEGGEWPIWGLPKSVIIHTDNAKEFSGRDLEFFCNEFGINLDHRPVTKPQFGGHVERFIGTINQKLHELPGSTFSNSQDRGEYDSEAKAIFTLAELEKWIMQFVTSIYNKTIHSDLGISPIEKYEEGIFGDDENAGTGYPEIVQGEYLEKMRIALLPSFTRTVQREGVVFERVYYFSDVLRKYVKAKDKAGGPCKQFTFRYDPRSMKKLYFYDPDIKDFLEIPYRNLRNPDISLWELKEVRRRLKAEKVTRYSEDEIFLMFNKLQAIEDDAASKSKDIRRKISRKSHHKKKMDETKAESSDISKSAINTSTKETTASYAAIDKEVIFEVDI